MLYTLVLKNYTGIAIATLLGNDVTVFSLKKYENLRFLKIFLKCQCFKCSVF